jgi:adenine-specific DNA-methyltransferase
MPSLQFKGKVFVQNHHLAVPFHELIPVKSRGLSKKASLHDNLIIEGDNWPRSRRCCRRITAK